MKDSTNYISTKIYKPRMIKKWWNQEVSVQFPALKSSTYCVCICSGRRHFLTCAIAVLHIESARHDSQLGMFAVASFTILTRVTTLSGTPGGGRVKFLGGGMLS